MRDESSITNKNVEKEKKNAVCDETVEEDPLDAFMKEINKVIEEENKKVENNSNENINELKESFYTKNACNKKERNTEDLLLDNTLDDNDVTADVFEFMEQKKKGKSFKENFDENSLESDNNDNDSFSDNDKNPKQEVIFETICYEKEKIEPFIKYIFEVDESIKEFTFEESKEYMKKNNIIVNGSNIPKPIYSFLQLKKIVPKPILQHLYDQSINILSPIQSIVLPTFLCGRNFIASSRTGSGKTLCFVISLVIHMLYSNLKKGEEEREIHRRRNKNPEALILAPTKELCAQIYEVMNHISINKLKTIMLFQGLNYQKVYEELKKGVDVLIGNARLVVRFVNKKYLSLTNIKYVILDECDKLFEKQNKNPVISVLNNIRPDSIRCMFSSTFSKYMIYMVIPFLNDNPIIIRINENNALINQKFRIIEQDHKYNYLVQFLTHHVKEDQGIIFCNNKKNIINLYEQLKSESKLKSIVFDFIHGDIDQTERMCKFRNFQKKKTQILVSTDLMSRGIDITELNLVINYDCPNNIFNYTHRVGRCSRCNNKGTALTLIQPNEKKNASIIYSHLKERNEDIDRELEDFIVSNNLYNYAEIKSVKRKRDDVQLGVDIKKVQRLNEVKNVSLHNLTFQKSTNLQNSSLLKNANVINPDDELSSSSSEY